MKLWNDLTSDEQEGVILACLLLAVIGAIVALYFWMEHEERQNQAEWAAFSSTHGCRETHSEPSRLSLTTGVGFSASGQVGLVTGSTHIPARVGYTCDDGVTYWREK